MITPVAAIQPWRCIGQRQLCTRAQLKQKAAEQQIAIQCRDRREKKRRSL
ncbi:MAG: hypothetical protein ACLUOF_12620 [Ruminococcus sp.]